MNETTNKQEIRQGYAKFGDTAFMRVSGFVDRLEAGAYRVQRTMTGIVFDRMRVSLDELIVFDDSKSHEIMAEVRRFWALRDQYERYGIVHKRGFLMYGPPGTGKTSLLYSLAQEMAEEHDGVTLFLPTGGDPDWIGAAIKDLRGPEPDRACLVVMEDVELVYRNYPSELLELLDGGSMSQNVAFVGTTNHIQNLDARVRDRPSRFDIVIEIEGPSQRVREEYLVRKGVGKDVAQRIAEASAGMSFAHLKEFLVGHVILGKPVEDVSRQLRVQANIGGEEGEDDGDDDDDYLYGQESEADSFQLPKVD